MQIYFELFTIHSSLFTQKNCIYPNFFVPLHPICEKEYSRMKGALEYTEQGWRVATDTTRHHRSKRWDYKGEGIYHITMTVAERYPLFGELVGDSPEQARIALTPFGKSINHMVRDLPSFYAPKGIEIKVLAAQVMPDHIHLVLQVLEPMERPVGEIVRSFKSAATSLYKREYNNNATNGGNNAAKWNASHQNENPQHQKGVAFARIFASTSSLWQPNPAGYHDRFLYERGQLRNMIDYVHDNPRRLWLKRANPDLFRIHQQTSIAGVACTTLGNMFLAERPQRAVLQCSRKLTQAEIETRKNECLDDAANGSVFITAAISEGEKQIARALREAGYPLIVLLEKGFPKPDDPHYKFFKPSGVYFEACAAEKLLLVEPHPDLFELPEVVALVTAKAGDIPHDSLRYRFLALNAIAEKICAA